MAMFSREQIEGARPGYFIAWLRPFETYCAARGVQLDEASARADLWGWVRGLYRVLSAPDATRPAALRDAVRRVTQLADEEGYERLISVLASDHAAIETVFADRPTPVELALYAFQQRPAAFDRAFRHMQLDATDRFWEFLPAAHRPLDAIDRPETTTLLASRIADRYRRRGQTGFAEVAVERTKRETRLLLMHGVASRALSIIDEAEQRAHARFTPERCDYAVVDHCTGRLSLHVAQPTSVPFFRQLLGEALYGQRDHFSRADIYSGRPILEHGAASLSVAGVPALCRVQLRGCRIVGTTGSAWSFESESCVFADEDDAEAIRLAGRRPGARVTDIRLAITHAHDGRTRRLDIVGANRIRMPKAIAQLATRTFLALRGLADYGSAWSLCEDAA